MIRCKICTRQIPLNKLGLSKYALAEVDGKSILISPLCDPCARKYSALVKPGVQFDSKLWPELDVCLKRMGFQ